MADSTLEAIRKKVRRITRSPSPTQITNDEIDEYINTFMLYDLPNHLRLFSLKTTFTFFTEPYIDTYDSDNVAPELDDFKNEYASFEAPVYVAGKMVPLYFNREYFFGAYPKDNFKEFLTNGDGVTVNFTGTLASTPIVNGQVLFSSIDADNETAELHDVEDYGVTGVLEGDGTGTIDYVTGEYSLIFNDAPAANVAINAQTVPYIASIPQAILFYDNRFVVRPIPDQAYRVDIEARKLPTELLLNTQHPDLKQWWQYIAIAASEKIFYDRMDIESVQRIQPLLKEQEILVNRVSEDQQSRNKIHTMFNSGSRSRRSPFCRW